MNILVVNQFNSDNLGDKLLNDAMCRQLNRMGHDYKNLGFAQTRNQSVQFSQGSLRGDGLVSKLKRRLPPFLKYYIYYKKRLKKEQEKVIGKKYDLMIIGGGQLVKHKSVFMYCLRNWVNYACRNNIVVVLYGVSIDSGMNMYEKKIYKRIFGNISSFNVRERQSQDVLKDDYSIRAMCSPDIAFSYLDIIKNERLKKKNELVVMPYNYHTAKFNFNSLDSRNNYYKYLLKKVRDNNGKKIILTATTSSDLQECYSFSKYLNGCGIENTIMPVDDIDKLMIVLGAAKVVITGRMHAMILGELLGCDITPIIISSKIERFCKNYLKDTGRERLEKIAKESVSGFKRILSIRYEK